eukprot:26261-Rhodomonas_salina.4
MSRRTRMPACPYSHSVEVGRKLTVTTSCLAWRTMKGVVTSLRCADIHLVAASSCIAVLSRSLAFPPASSMTQRVRMGARCEKRKRMHTSERAALDLSARLRVRPRERENILGGQDRCAWVAFRNFPEQPLDDLWRLRLAPPQPVSAPRMPCPSQEKPDATLGEMWIIGATRTKPSKSAGCFIAIDTATPPPIDSPCPNSRRPFGRFASFSHSSRFGSTNFCTKSTASSTNSSQVLMKRCSPSERP